MSPGQRLRGADAADGAVGPDFRGHALLVLEAVEAAGGFAHAGWGGGAWGGGGEGRGRHPGTSGAWGLGLCPPESSASRSLRGGSSTATTLHAWRLDEVAADCAAATISSSCSGSTGVGR